MFFRRVVFFFHFVSFVQNTLRHKTNLISVGQIWGILSYMRSHSKATCSVSERASWS